MEMRVEKIIKKIEVLIEHRRTFVSKDDPFATEMEKHKNKLKELLKNGQK